MFSITTTESSISRENASASPLSTMESIDLPGAVQNEKRDEHRNRNGEKNGDRGAKASQKDQDHHAGQQDSDAAFAQHRGNGFLDKHRLVEGDVTPSAATGMSRRFLMAFLMPFTTAIVLVSPPCFWTATYTDFWPSTRTMLYCSAEPSTALPTSEMKTDFSPSVLRGTSLRALRVWHLRVRVDVVVDRAEAHIAGRQNQVG